MTQNTQRQEPTFGEPSLNNPFNGSAKTEAEAEIKAKPNLSFSLHSKQSPGHTFTPVLKRPAELAQHFSTLEEQEMLKHTPPSADTAEPNSIPEPTPSTAQPTTQPRNFVFTPAEPESSETVEAPKAEPTVLKAEPLLAKPNAEKVAEKAVEKTAETATGSAPEPKDTMERVVPTQPTVALKKNTTSTIPTKYRRLLLVLLLALALVLAFFLLKPKTPETVEELQQGTSLPIEFRPVDEAEAKRAEEEAKALQAQAEVERQAQAQAEQANAATQAVENPQPNAQSGNNSTAPTIQPSNAENAKSETVKSDSPKAEQAKTDTPKAEPVRVEPVKKPAISGSVIYQPEKATTKLERAEKANTVEKVEKTKATSPSTTLVKKAEPKAEPKAEAKSAEPVAQGATSKTLIAKAGVTLFQNFRDNGLTDNLPELNKMTKLNGKTSELKPGQKIVVRLDAQKRIVEMNIGSGKYLRQADGSYIYK